jgi:fructosamine-3-kinase
MLTPRLKKAISEHIGEVTGKISDIRDVDTVGGGSINDAYKVYTGNEHYFVKINRSGIFPGMFESESRGLDLLRNAGGPPVPAVISVGSAGDTDFLILEFAEAGKRLPEFNEVFGAKLAFMHRNTATSFGLDHDNYIGSLSQRNKMTPNGISFFIEERLMPQSELAYRNRHFSVPDLELLDTLYIHLESVLPKEPPALLHGDLWSGNYITGPDGNAWLVDPAVYYGFRESDLAMTRLFGGFDDRFYASYMESFPLHPGWEKRIPLFQLYPLLVHVNLFGNTYLRTFREMLKASLAI